MKNAKKYSIYGAELANTQLIRKYNKRESVLLCLTDIYKHAWVILLEDKKVLQSPMHFSIFFFVNQTRYEWNFRIDYWSHGCITISLKCIQNTMKENLFLLKDLSGPWGTFRSIIPSIKKFVQIDKVFHKCNNTNGVEP